LSPLVHVIWRRREDTARSFLIPMRIVT
jgi:hypothetical protein